MIAYKRVRVDEWGDLYSSYAHNHAQVQYLPHEWVEPPEHAKKYGQGLFVFSDPNAAIAWGDGEQVWKVEAENLRTPPTDVVFLEYLEDPEICDFGVEQQPYFPQYTMWADRVMLLEKVYDVKGDNHNLLGDEE